MMRCAIARMDAPSALNLRAANWKNSLDEFEDEAFFDEFSAEADDIDTIYDDLSFSRRSAGFDVRGASSVMDTNRYVAVPKKKRRGGWLLIACLAVALIAWRMGWFA